MSDREELIQLLNAELAMAMPAKITFTELKEILALHINSLIGANFQKLVSVLYRVDINETRLRNLLKENVDANAGMIIADLIIERQLQKLKSRKENRKNDSIPDEDKW